MCVCGGGGGGGGAKVHLEEGGRISLVFLLEDACNQNTHYRSGELLSLSLKCWQCWIQSITLQPNKNPAGHGTQ